MKLNGTIYFYAPKESDLEDRDILREHLCRPTAGRVFLQVDEDHQWTIPFGSTTQLVGILNKVRMSENANLDFSSEKRSVVKKDRTIADRRCLRIEVKDADPRHDPSKYGHLLDKKRQNKIKRSMFAQDSTGVFIQLDCDEDYKYKKMYFTDMFDAGTKLDKMFSGGVAKRIPVNDIFDIPYDVED